jgi:hypothetical protein
MENWWIYLIVIAFAIWVLRPYTKEFFSRKSYHRRKRVEPVIGCISEIDVGDNDDG